MKRYQKLIMEWNQLSEIGIIGDAVVGGILRSGYAAGMWAHKRSQLMKRLNDCGSDLRCQSRIKEEIKQFNRDMIKKGSIMAATGAATGGAIGYGITHMPGYGQQTNTLPDGTIEIHDGDATRTVDPDTMVITSAS